MHVHSGVTTTYAQPAFNMHPNISYYKLKLMAYDYLKHHPLTI